MILSCVKRIHDRLGYYVGAAVIARTLQGSREKKLLELGLQELSTYGLMKTLGRTQIRGMIEHLELEGYLTTEAEHQTVRLLPEASEVLYRGKRVAMPLRKEQEEKPEKLQMSAEASDLYDELRALRAQLAREANVPAYVVFSNATLQDMARKCPRNMTEFKKVSGVGELKANWYGKAFLERIRAYLEQR